MFKEAPLSLATAESTQLLTVTQGGVSLLTSISPSSRNCRFNAWSTAHSCINKLLYILCLCFAIQTVRGQAPECDWPELDPPCNTDFEWLETIEIYVPVSSSPPCSVKVRVYGARACDNIEILDLAWYMDDVVPVGCMTRDQIFESFNYGVLAWMSYTETLKHIFRTETTPIQYPCPTVRTYNTGIAVACSRPQIIWTIPGLPNVVVLLEGCEKIGPVLS